MQTKFSISAAMPAGLVVESTMEEGDTTLVRARSVAVRAGVRLGLSQPAVSAALGRLRVALGDELFFRRGQGMEPTRYALSLEAPLRETLEKIEGLIRAPDTFDPRTSTARLRVSGSDFFAEMLMPHLAERLQSSAPSISVHLVDLVPDSYIDTLERYRVDLALIPRLSLPEWLQSRTVFRSTFSVIARRGHPKIARAALTPGAVVPLDLFCEIGHVVFSPEGNATAMGDKALAGLGRERRVVMTLPVFSGIYRAVSGSDLIALLPTSLARHIAPLAALDIYRPPMTIDPVEIVMVWHRRDAANPAHAWLRDQIATLLRPLDDLDGLAIGSELSTS